MVDPFPVALSYKTDLKNKLNLLIDREQSCRKVFSYLSTAVANCKTGIYTSFEDMNSILSAVMESEILDGSAITDANELLSQSEQQLIMFASKINLLKGYESNESNYATAEEMKKTVNFYPFRKEDHDRIKLTCDIYITIYNCRDSINRIRSMADGDLDNGILFNLRELKKAIVRLSMEATDREDKSIVDSTKDTFLLVDWCYEVRYILQNNSSIEVAEKLLAGDNYNIT